jgi:hypothetical protein
LVDDVFSLVVPFVVALDVVPDEPVAVGVAVALDEAVAVGVAAGVAVGLDEAVAAVAGWVSVSPKKDKTIPQTIHTARPTTFTVVAVCILSNHQRPVFLALVCTVSSFIRNDSTGKTTIPGRLGRKSAGR